VGGAPNGVLQPPEQCDDGNLVATDDCLNDCTLPFCGDQVVHAGVEECDGGPCCTPTCTLVAADVLCRPAAGSCDLDEFCTGTDAACPADVKKPAGTECRAAVDVCDAAETCDGSSAACPADALQPNGTVCRPATSTCDIAEVCNGTTPSCPADAVKPAGALCRPAAGLCDREEYCDGSGQCPADALKIAGELCRPSAGICDDPDFCDGMSANCPDARKPSTFVCRPSTGTCDVQETCNGGTSCPADTFAPGGTTCDDGSPCTTADACDGMGHCTGQSCVDDKNPCTADSCDPMAGCVHTPVTNGLVCDDGDPCTTMDACVDGVCTGVVTAADTDGDGYCDFQEIEAGCAVDDAAEIPPQRTVFGGRPAGRADVLLTYAAPAGRDVSPTSDPSCATAGRCGRFGTCNTTTHKCTQDAARSCSTDADCVFGARGFCTAGKLQDPCVANADCDQPAATCRVVVNFAAVSGLRLERATLNGKTAVPGFTPIHGGCSRKVDVQLDSSRSVNRLKLRASGPQGTDTDGFRYR
jgi:cysteine-rich repeat protein